MLTKAFKILCTIVYDMHPYLDRCLASGTVEEILRWPSGLLSCGRSGCRNACPSRSWRREACETEVESWSNEVGFDELVQLFAGAGFAAVKMEFISLPEATIPSGPNGEHKSCATMSMMVYVLADACWC